MSPECDITESLVCHGFELNLFTICRQSRTCSRELLFIMPIKHKGNESRLSDRENESVNEGNVLKVAAGRQETSLKI